MARRRRRLLVPEARTALDQLKMDVTNTVSAEEAKFKSAKQQNVPLQKGYNGHLTAEQAGKVGGPIGGQMVKKMIALAQMQLMNEQNKEQQQP